jgi:hypothetical protein
VSTPTQEKRGRPVTAEEAIGAFRRLVNSHFNNKDQARCSIPADHRDDDITLGDYLLEVEFQLTASRTECERVTAERDKFKGIVDESTASFLNLSNSFAAKLTETEAQLATLRTECEGLRKALDVAHEALLRSCNLDETKAAKLMQETKAKP